MKLKWWMLSPKTAPAIQKSLERYKCPGWIRRVILGICMAMTARSGGLGASTLIDGLHMLDDHMAAAREQAREAEREEHLTMLNQAYLRGIIEEEAAEGNISGHGAAAHLPLSEHLKVGDFTNSQTASDKGIDNSLGYGTVQFYAARRLAKHLYDPLVRQFGIDQLKINSGYRSKELNDALPHASETSQHMKGQALDITVVNPTETFTNLQLFNYIHNNLLFDQLIWEGTPDNGPGPRWVHVSYVSTRKNRNEVVYLPDLQTPILQGFTYQTSQQEEVVSKDIIDDDAKLPRLKPLD